MIPAISIAIPTYEMSGMGDQYLTELFDTINSQTLRDFEVCISDHSLGDSILKVCEKYANFFTIQYYKNYSNIGNGSANTNSVVEMCSGMITKIMFQDDLFISDNALHVINSTFKKFSCNWCFNGFTHTNNGIDQYRPMIPQWTDMMLEGRNLLGSPSTISFNTNKFVKFDEKLVLLMDTDFYHRMRQKNGDPYIISQYLISNREHNNRVSALVKYDKIMEHPDGNWMVNQAELNYILSKHYET